MLEIEGFDYSLNFKKLADNKIEVNRAYKTERKNITPKEYEDFKKFMSAINEAENTHLLF